MELLILGLRIFSITLLVYLIIDFTKYQKNCSQSDMLAEDWQLVV